MKRLFIFLLAAFLLLCSCGTSASPRQRYENGMTLYGEKRYGEAAAVFKKLGNYEDAAAMAEKCALLALWQDEKAGEEFVSEWVAHVKKAHSGPYSFGSKTGIFPSNDFSAEKKSSELSAR